MTEPSFMTQQPEKYWNIQGRRYPGYGRCIYCGSSGGADGLRDEHIIPFALGGNTWIEKASCRRCEQAINPVDTHLGRSVYGQFRIHANIQTRHPRDRPTVLSANFTIGGEERSVNLPIADHPYALSLPIWGDAGLLRSALIDDPFPKAFWNIYHWTPPKLRGTLGLGENEDFRIWQAGRINPTLFARGIAKIAYCNAIVRYGLDGFRRLAMPSLILGKFSGVAYFVGGPLIDPPPPNPRVLHAVKLLELAGIPYPHTGERRLMKLYVASVRLFADSAYEQNGMPIYHVIVGAPKLTNGNAS
jgi:hypothetical protein